MRNCALAKSMMWAEKSYSQNVAHFPHVEVCSNRSTFVSNVMLFSKERTIGPQKIAHQLEDVGCHVNVRNYLSNTRV